MNLVVKHPAFFAAVLLGLAAVEGCSPRPTPETAAPAVSAIPRAADGRPDLNGVWQALSSANWNLEAHAATAVPSLWRLGALGAGPAGQSVVVGGTIP